MSGLRVRTYALIVTAIFQLFMLSGCSFKVGIDWQGETAKDERVFSPKK
jgi:hypothetical protein